MNLTQQVRLLIHGLKRRGYPVKDLQGALEEYIDLISDAETGLLQILLDDLTAKLDEATDKARQDYLLHWLDAFGLTNKPEGKE